jgi:lipoyl(octanoyl) transferase
MNAASPAGPPEWRVAPGLADYVQTVTAMEERVAAIRNGSAPELVWLVEHPPLYTAGTSARPEELLDPHALPVHQTGRGGRWTWHGPGQRVAYLMLDLETRRLGVHAFVARIEAWVIATLALLGVEGRTIAGKTGIWVGDAKLAAIGVRVRRWVSFHGVAINVTPDLSHYAGIVPCGLADPVTSLKRLGASANMAALDAALADTFAGIWESEPIRPDRDTRALETLAAGR